MGGIDTGCIDLETSGMWGYNTFFNFLIPRGGPMNAPVLGISVGSEKFVLSSLRTKENWMKGGVMKGEDNEQNDRKFARGGGFIFAPINMIQNDVPAENIIALAEPVKECR